MKKLKIKLADQEWETTRLMQSLSYADLPPTAFKILFGMCYWFCQQKGYCYIGDLKLYCGLSKATIRKHLPILEAKGYIMVDRTHFTHWYKPKPLDGWPVAEDVEIILPRKTSDPLN
jgi:hypothetical protein